MIKYEYENDDNSSYKMTRRPHYTTMAATELKDMGGTVDGIAIDRELQASDGRHKRGGWITFPFIAGTVMGLTLAGGGWMTNLIVYLIEEFNINSIDAAQFANVIYGCLNLFPIIGAMIADSYLGSFAVIVISYSISSLGTIFVALTASLNSLRPPPCEIGSTLCRTPSKMQYAVLYIGLVLAAMGQGPRIIFATMGANQFDKPQHKEVFFNWYFFAIYISLVISATGIVYIEENISWRFGFSICIAANLIGFVIFLLGYRFYVLEKPQDSPFVGIARVIIATVRKRKLILSSRTEDYYQDENRISNVVTRTATPEQSFRFLNRAALKTEGDIRPDGSLAKPWRLCTVQQVEDLKRLIRIFPLWLSSIFLSTAIGTHNSLMILQALTMDRHLAPHFKIPAGSFLVISLVTTTIFLTLIDTFLLSWWKKLTRNTPTPLQRIGVGHIINVVALGVSALVESKRLKIVQTNHLQHQPGGSIVPMMGLWLFPQLVLEGIGQAFRYPGQVALYYQESPASLRSTATAVIALILGTSFYLSTALIHLFRRVTNWLPDNINNGRLDNVYWSLVVIGSLDFVYFLACSSLYKYRNVHKGEDATSNSL